MERIDFKFQKEKTCISDMMKISIKFLICLNKLKHIVKVMFNILAKSDPLLVEKISNKLIKTRLLPHDAL